jgi:methyl halide transferase
MPEEKCCTISCESPLDGIYWNNQYQANSTAWDLGQVSPPIKRYIDTLQHKDVKILIPGCGNAYEAEYLNQQGFTDITVIDIAPLLVEKLKQNFAKNKNIKIVLGDFFEHQGKYDYIFEQTFFCALLPAMRQKYVWKMHQLLADKGKLVGLLFNRDFEISPPFGGNQLEYEQLFKEAFLFHTFSIAENSILPRSKTEFFIEFQKNNELEVNLYSFEGITCSGCKHKVVEKLVGIESIVHASMSSNFAEVLITSTKLIPIEKLQDAVSYDAKYVIKKQD